MSESAGDGVDIELGISRGKEPGQYAVRVLQAASGAMVSGTFRLDVEDLVGQRSYLEGIILSSAVRSRRSRSLEELEVQRIGQTLFEALFSGEVYGAYRASLAAAHQSGQRLRVVLALGAPELAALPWETLFDPEAETYLCRTEPLVRRVTAPVLRSAPLRVDLPLRILGIVAAPADLPPLDGAAERRRLERALAQKSVTGQIELVWAESATWEEIHRMLLDGPWHVIHFIGHGEFNARADEGHLMLVGPEGTADPIEANRLADLFSAAHPAPRLVVLNSCSSGESGAEDLFSSTATALVRGGMRAVTAMQFAISDEAAILFAQGFYSALASGRSVDEAARNGRISIRGGPRGTLEWITPVLYAPGGSNQLFDIPAAEDLPAEEGVIRNTPAPPDAGALNAAYVKALAEIRVGNHAAALRFLDEVLGLDSDYRDAAALYAEASRISRPAELFRKAMAAEAEGDYTLASRLYSEVLEISPDFPEAADRRARCRTMQRVNDLQAEIRVHTAAHRWQAVLDVTAELEGMDPPAAAPEGLAESARLELLWDEATAASTAGDIDAAFQSYTAIVEKAPGFRDAMEQRKTIEQELTLRHNLSEWHDQMELDAAAGKWQAIIDTITELESRGILTADPGPWKQPRPSFDDLAYRARRALLAQFHEKEQLRAAGKALEGDPQLSRTIACPAPGKPGTEPPKLRAASAAESSIRKSNGAFKARRSTSVATGAPISAAAFSPDGTKIATAGGAAGTAAQVFDLTANGRRIQQMKGYGQPTALSFSPDSKWIMALDILTVTIFSADTGRRKIKVKPSGIFGQFLTAAFTPDSQSITTLDTKGKATTWSLTSGNIIREKRISTIRIQAAAFSADGSHLVTVDPRPMASLWDVNVLKKTGFMSNIRPREGAVVAVSPTGRRISAPDLDGNPIIGPSTSTVIVNPLTVKIKLEEPLVSVLSLVFSPDDGSLAVVDARGQFSVYDATTGARVLRLEDVRTEGVAFSPAGDAFALWEGAMLSIWSLNSRIITVEGAVGRSSVAW